MIKTLFPGQQPDEQIHKITRQHWMMLSKQIAVWLIFVVALLAYDIFAVREFAMLRNPEVEKFAAVIKGFYLMFLIAGLFTIWIVYYLNYQIITNNRIVDVDQKGLLFHATTEIHLAQIEDVTAEIKGLFGNLFNYGTVFVQTAGAKTMFEFDNVPDPKYIAKLILDLYERVPHGVRISSGEEAKST
ncbi:MAG: hypothetical protein A2846_01920 [Candidatus Doudnabacteria bacterium RIFCSPHIGHO2_01_FULL_49_9]|uniref:YdbS-like PH domain-containing protein n=1 Tax=Candidatus Doudnabacteria bacterium RIFCSPHIGHO2_01_FULL_49_9 TaxID=1817827 RepID=A0A1F5P398_9BACT|nr:MAG: hypothetical protein A2846_01920 [Candidatus Doudnabacteria bacterium RIFCSPHIGHO2_01_FULL_49_9]